MRARHTSLDMTHPDQKKRHNNQRKRMNTPLDDTSNVIANANLNDATTKPPPPKVTATTDGGLLAPQVPELVRKQQHTQPAELLKNTDPASPDNCVKESDSIQWIRHNTWCPSINNKDEALDLHFLRLSQAPYLALQQQGSKLPITFFHRCHNLSDYCKNVKKFSITF